MPEPLCRAFPLFRWVSSRCPNESVSSRIFEETLPDDDRGCDCGARRAARARNGIVWPSMRSSSRWGVRARSSRCSSAWNRRAHEHHRARDAAVPAAGALGTTCHTERASSSSWAGPDEEPDARGGRPPRELNPRALMKATDRDRGLTSWTRMNACGMAATMEIVWVAKQELLECARRNAHG